MVPSTQRRDLKFLVMEMQSQCPKQLPGSFHFVKSDRCQAAKCNLNYDALARPASILSPMHGETTESEV